MNRNTTENSNCRRPRFTLRLSLAINALVTTLFILLTQWAWAQTATDKSTSNSIQSAPYVEITLPTDAKNTTDTAARIPSAPDIFDLSKPFNKYTWVTAHNAYNGDTEEVLESGVRGLMWDLHPIRLAPPLIPR